MRVLISAYACQPDVGSEPQVGFEIVRAAAREHEVWVITRTNNVDAVKRSLSRSESHRVRVIGLDLGEFAQRAKRRLGRTGVMPYYGAWQKRVGRLALDLDRDLDFDVVHHATFATYWARIGVSKVPKPLVVGPVGGGAVTPIRLWPVLGLRGLPGELGRRLLRPMIARSSGARAVLARAEIVLLQNDETGRAAGVVGTVLPNGLLGSVTATIDSHRTEPGPVVFAGRIVGWKGPMLAVAAWRHFRDDDPGLVLFGDGPDRRRLERAVSRWGLRGRVDVRGAVPREEVLEAVADAGAFIHPALHDDSPLSVAEAMSLGTPVVCLDLAGPPVIASHWSEAQSSIVAVASPKRTALALSVSVAEVYGRRFERDSSPRDRFTDGVLSAYRSAAS